MNRKNRRKVKKVLKENGVLFHSEIKDILKKLKKDKR